MFIVENGRGHKACKGLAKVYGNWNYVRFSLLFFRRKMF